MGGLEVEEQQTEELWVIVAAAGESRRMGLPDGESKQFLLLGGEPILNYSCLLYTSPSPRD